MKSDPRIHVRERPSVYLSFWVNMTFTIRFCLPDAYPFLISFALRTPSEPQYDLCPWESSIKKSVQAAPWFVRWSSEATASHELPPVMYVEAFAEVDELQFLKYKVPTAFLHASSVNFPWIKKELLRRQVEG